MKQSTVQKCNCPTSTGCCRTSIPINLNHRTLLSFRSWLAAPILRQKLRWENCWLHTSRTKAMHSSSLQISVTGEADSVIRTTYQTLQVLRCHHLCCRTECEGSSQPQRSRSTRMCTRCRL